MLPTTIVLGSALLAGVGGSGEPPSAVPDFDRDVRPILADNCFACHGPDEAARKAGLRLDVREGATAPRAHGAALVPGSAAGSLLLDRVTSDDPGERMPPPEAKKLLGPEEIDVLRAWIDAGAEWSEHWAFVPPVRPAPPAAPSEHAGWPKSALDAFVLARLSEHGLEPTGPAAPERWLRRVTLDLTGLPPTLEEQEAFLADPTDAAREAVVDRLFASPAYGEHMALAWLDAARYADTNGYHYDNERSMWRWRDWVVRAFDENLPFDLFSTEQLAGDLLDDPTTDQLVATGFHRNHPISWEGGIVPEEYLTEYVVDRVDTTGSVWLGLTVGCARCHDHKFDPISQEEFFRFYDFFNRVPENGLDGLQGNAEPVLTVPDEETELELARLRAERERLAGRRARPDPELEAAEEAWARDARAAVDASWTVLEPFTFRSLNGADLALEPDGSLFQSGIHPANDVVEVTTFTTEEGIVALRLEALADERLPRGGPGRASHANIVLSEIELEVAPLDQPSARERVRFVHAHADHSQRGFHVTRAIDGDSGTGWALEGSTYGEDRIAVFVPAEPLGFRGGTAVHVTLRHDSGYAQHSLGRFRLSVTTAGGDGYAPSELRPWYEVGPFLAESREAAFETAFAPEAGFDATARFEGGLAWTERPEWGDGAVHAFEGDRSLGATYVARTIRAPTARTMRVSLGSDDGLRVLLNGEEVHANPAARGAAPDQDFVDLELARGENELMLVVADYGGASGFYFDVREDGDLAVPLAVESIVRRDPDARSDEQRGRLRDLFRGAHSAEWRESTAELARLDARVSELEASVPNTMIMRDMPMPRGTFVLERGAYDRPGDPVTAGVPAVLPPLPQGSEADRLALARWLFDPAHPLTARVAVNRLWARCFGRGIVATPADFGTQGARPTHPDLLDWLALELIESGWDLQHVLRTIVLSATYSQDSVVDARRLERDPDGRWLSRAPRVQLTGEAIRDAALGVGGLLDPRVGGPPVKPYQPDGLWREVGSDFNAFSANAYQPSEGADLFRRSLYTFRKRSVPPPNLLAFDTPTREFCEVARSRTNTPLQALVLWNDPTFVEAARGLAQRLFADDGFDGDRSRLARAWRLALGRDPTGREADVLLELLDEERERFAGDPMAAARLLAVGESPRDEMIDAVEHAAWAVVCQALLQSDEFITRP